VREAGVDAVFVDCAPYVAVESQRSARLTETQLFADRPDTDVSRQIDTAPAHGNHVHRFYALRKPRHPASREGEIAVKIHRQVEDEEPHADAVR
jgi:hypothetical protein